MAGKSKAPTKALKKTAPKKPAAKKKSSADLKARATEIARRLGEMYPDAKCSLDYKNPLQLIIATILSAQCTDVRVNMVTPELFKRYPTADAMAAADLPDLERLIQSTGFYRNKAKNIKECCRLIATKHGGKVPNTLEELVELPGVARKTANVVLGNAYGIPGITVDTHVGRLSRRMGLTGHEDPVKVERDLNELLPSEDWTVFSHRMIYHGRAVCAARRPLCEECRLSDICPKIGVAS